MELNWILIWLCGVSSAINLVMSVQNRRAPLWGWRAVLTAILLLLGALLITVPDFAGYMIAPIWFVFALLPGLLMRRVNQMLSVQKYRRAYWQARIAGWLHPCDGWPQQADLVRALALFERGHTDQAGAIISRLGHIDASLGRTARLIQAQQSGNWQALLDWIDSRYSSATIDRDDALLIARLQALGELGRTSEMLTSMQRVMDHVGGVPAHSRAVLRMRVAALSGQVAATQRQLNTLTETYPPDVRTYWFLTAQQVAGSEGVSEELRALQTTASAYLQPMIARRLSEPLPVFEQSAAGPDSVATLATLAEQIDEDMQHAVWSGDSPHRPWATWGIAFVLVASFVREMSGVSGPPSLSLPYLLSLLSRSQDPGHLIDLGALVVPQSFTPDEWWRILTAGFLHFGPLHLALNLLGLLALAPRLERAWGPLPMIVCYLVATFTSMALAPHVMNLSDGPPLRILVGASGGMMGLLGGLVGFLSIGWYRHRSEQTRRTLVFLLLIVVLQVSFDLTTPNVSFACHSLGLATGLLFGIAWSSYRRRPAAS